MTDVQKLFEKVSSGRELFEEAQFGSLTLKNRFSRSATWEGLADESGAPTDALIEHMRKLAGGGVGLVIGSYAFVCEAGRSTVRQLGITDDSVIPQYKKMIATMKEAAPDVKVVLQIVHAGVTANGDNYKDEDRRGPSTLDLTNVVVRKHKGFTVPEIKELIQQFIDAAVRCEKIGFDGVQLHGAHGFLMTEMASPFFNKRTDEWGGSPQNRARFATEIIHGIRKVCKPEFAILMKHNCEDFLGYGVDDALAVALEYEKAGIEGIELSAGVWWTTPHPLGFLGPDPKHGRHQPEAYWKEQSKRYKAAMKIPVAMVGGFRSHKACEEMLDNEICDFIGLARPLISDPNIINQWKEADIEGEFGPNARCISCNKCFMAAVNGQDIVECIYLKEKRLAGKMEQLTV